MNEGRITPHSRHWAIDCLMTVAVSHNNKHRCTSLTAAVHTGVTYIQWKHRACNMTLINALHRCRWLRPVVSHVVDVLSYLLAVRPVVQEKGSWNVCGAVVVVRVVILPPEVSCWVMKLSVRHLYYNMCISCAFCVCLMQAEILSCVSMCFTVCSRVDHVTCAQWLIRGVTQFDRQQLEAHWHNGCLTDSTVCSIIVCQDRACLSVKAVPACHGSACLSGQCLSVCEGSACQGSACLSRQCLSVCQDSACQGSACLSRHCLSGQCLSRQCLSVRAVPACQDCACLSVRAVPVKAVPVCQGSVCLSGQCLPVCEGSTCQGSACLSRQCLSVRTVPVCLWGVVMRWVGVCLSGCIKAHVCSAVDVHQTWTFSAALLAATWPRWTLELTQSVWRALELTAMNSRPLGMHCVVFAVMLYHLLICTDSVYCFLAVYHG